MPAGQEAAWVVSEISLEQLWRTVDSIRVGKEGYALLLAEEQRFIAHGNPNRKRFVATSSQTGTEKAEEQKLAGRLVQQVDSQTGVTDTYRHEDGRSILAAAWPVPKLPWVVIVEQPTSEAFVLASRLQRQLLVAIGLALLGTVILGWVWGRSFITRIFALTKATQALAEGRM
jgi:hypothetical protein